MNWFLICLVIILSVVCIWAIVWAFKANIKACADLDKQHPRPPVEPSD
ncbi:MAG: hypothetical protein WCF94_00385 [bacterium]